jgi:hypothetical protein
LRNKNKFKDVKALVGVEYTYDVDEEDSDEEDIVGVADLALAKAGSLFKYDYTKDYESSTKNTPHKCLMAKEAKVILPPPPTFLSHLGHVQWECLERVLTKINQAFS